LAEFGGEGGQGGGVGIDGFEVVFDGAGEAAWAVKREGLFDSKDWLMTPFGTNTTASLLKRSCSQECS
jgi:hypothetical protein